MKGGHFEMLRNGIVANLPKKPIRSFGQNKSDQ